MLGSILGFPYLGKLPYMVWGLGLRTLDMSYELNLGFRA